MSGHCLFFSPFIAVFALQELAEKEKSLSEKAYDNFHTLNETY